MATAPIAPDSTRVDSIAESEAAALAATLVDLGWDKLLAELTKRARSRRGATLCAAIGPLDIDAALARQREIGEARALRDEAQPMPLDGVHDLADALSRSEKGGALEPAALVDIASTLRAGAAAKRHVLKRRAIAPGLSGRAVLIDELDELASMLERAFRGGSTEEGGSESGPTGPRLADGASPALSSLRRRTRQIREELERALDRLLDASEVAPHLQDRYFTLREDRYVLPIRVEARAKVRGIVHGGSQSGQTVFVEPEALVELNNRKKLADWEVLEEERRILMELSAEVEAQMPAIQVNLEVLAQLDLVDACARLAIDLRAAPPELIDRNGELDLRRARHPLMELSGKRCVPNDLIVGGGQALVLSGPNAGGKTVALKIAGLLSWMARAGLHVPAQEGSRVPMFEVVRCDVGDAQSIERDLSTFSAHVQSLRAYLAVARPGALILLDEIAGGTDPGEGASLAQAVLEALVERGATVIATTHYDRLRLLPTSDARFKNASVGYDLEQLQPTFTLTLGIPGASAALSVARRLGLDPRSAIVQARSRAKVRVGSRSCCRISRTSAGACRPRARKPKPSWPRRRMRAPSPRSARRRHARRCSKPDAARTTKPWPPCAKRAPSSIARPRCCAGGRSHPTRARSPPIAARCKPRRRRCTRKRPRPACRPVAPRRRPISSRVARCMWPASAGGRRCFRVRVVARCSCKRGRSRSPSSRARYTSWTRRRRLRLCAARVDTMPSTSTRRRSKSGAAGCVPWMCGASGSTWPSGSRRSSSTTHCGVETKKCC